MKTMIFLSTIGAGYLAWYLGPISDDMLLGIYIGMGIVAFPAVIIYLFAIDRPTINNHLHYHESERPGYNVTGSAQNRLEVRR